MWAFIGISIVVIVIPGPDTLLVAKNSLLHGRAVGLETALGVAGGLLVWTIASAVGVAAVVHDSAVAFAVLKLCGAVYLIWLGAQSLRGNRQRAISTQANTPHRRSESAPRGFRQGFLSNLANPKVAVFFTSLLPQFISSREPILVPCSLLGGVFVLMTLAWLSGYALAAARASDMLTRSPIGATLERLAGILLIGLGVRLALERR